MSAGTTETIIFKALEMSQMASLQCGGVGMRVVKPAGYSKYLVWAVGAEKFRKGKLPDAGLKVLSASPRMIKKQDSTLLNCS